jgi:hypothetical protein
MPRAGFEFAIIVFSGNKISRVATVIGFGKLVILETAGIANKKANEYIKLLKLTILWVVGI